MAVFPHGSAPRVAVVPIGDPPATACETVAETVGETLDLSVPVHRAIEPPPDLESDAANAESVLERLETETGGIDLAVGVTDAPIRLDPHGFALFGVGLEFGTAGVVSTERLLEGTDPTDRERERLTKMALSVVGTMLGLRTYIHDDGSGQPCAAAAKDVRFELEATPPSYCEDCRAALTGESPLLEPPEPDAWVVRPHDGETLAFVDRWQRGEPKWRDYPLIAAGFAVARAERIGGRMQSLLTGLPRPGPQWARRLPRPVHTIYRIVSFWTTVFLYLGCIVLWLYALFSLSDWLFGTELSTIGVLVVLLVSVGAGGYTGLFLKAIAKGVYDGLRGVSVDDC